MQSDIKFRHFYTKFQIVIQDFGDGMPKDKLNSLFMDFSKLEDSKGKNT